MRGILSGNSDVTEKATSHIFTFAFAASSLVQAYRQLKSCAPAAHGKLEQIRGRLFADHGLTNFVQELRNCFGHARIFSANATGSIALSEEKVVKPTFHFDKVELLKHGNWNISGRKFIADNTRLDVHKIVDDYFRLAKSLFDTFGAESGVTLAVGFREMHRCRLAVELSAQSAWLRIVIQQTKNKNVNPYKYLPSYFTENELYKIHCLAPNSRYQVDYMIALKDPIGFCDDDLRSSLYELFQVSDT